MLGDFLFLPPCCDLEFTCLSCWSYSLIYLSTKLVFPTMTFKLSNVSYKLSMSCFIFSNSLTCVSDDKIWSTIRFSSLESTSFNIYFEACGFFFDSESSIVPAVKLFCFTGKSLFLVIPWFWVFLPTSFTSVFILSISASRFLKISVYLIFYSELLRTS